MIVVRTHSRLYRGAKLDINGRVLRVVREGASWRENGVLTTEVDVEPTIICVGDYTYKATEV